MFGNRSNESLKLNRARTPPAIEIMYGLVGGTGCKLIDGVRKGFGLLRNGKKTL
jgi:hypothetical protein